MKIYATSDTHFGHDKLVTMGRGRPTNFGEIILKNISRTHGDMLIHCGDFCIGNDTEHVKAYMEAAKGFTQRILVRGNHDSKSDNWYFTHGFTFVCESFLAKMFGKQFLFTHMPVRRDEAIFGPHFPPDRNIHGHLHGNANRHAVKEIYDPDFHYDLAPDVHGYGLVDLSRI